MALNTFKCNCWTPLHFKGLKIHHTKRVEQKTQYSLWQLTILFTTTDKIVIYQTQVSAMLYHSLVLPSSWYESICLPVTDVRINSFRRNQKAL